MHEAVTDHAAWIRNETLAIELEEAVRPKGEMVKAFDVYDERITIGIRRIST
jgi:isoleucyl-tRNA synthetase